MKRTEQLGIQYRDAEIGELRDVDTTRGKTQEATISIASEFPVERWFGMEVLSMEEEHMRLDRLNSGTGAVLVQHDHWDQIGAFKKDSMQVGDDKKLRGDVRFSRSTRAKELVDDLKDGIRGNTSVGYAVYAYERAIDLETIDPETEAAEVKYWRAIDWEPYEGSFVAAGADPTVGHGRAEKRTFEVTFSEPDPEPAAGDSTRNADPQPEPQPTRIQVRSDKTMAEPTADPKPVDQDALRQEGAAMEATRRNHITETAKAFKLKDGAEERFLADGSTPEAFMAHVQSEFNRNGGQDIIRTVDPRIGMGEKDRKHYSILRACRHVLDPSKEEAGFEREISQDAAKAARAAGCAEPGANAICVPWDVRMDIAAQRGRPEAMLLRANLTAGAAEGTELVGTEHRGDEFIEALRPRVGVMAAGATVLTGLQQNLIFPRQTATIAAGISATETGAFTAGAPTYDQLSMGPKIVNAYQPVSWELLVQGSPDVEGLVRDDLSKGLGEKMDQMALYGSGSSGEPTGIEATSGIGSVDFGEVAPTWAKVVETETDVAAANADVDAMKWLVNSQTRGKFKTTPVVSGQTLMLWDTRNNAQPLNGYPAIMTNHCRNNLGTGTAFSECYFGNWPEVLIGLWGGLYLLRDDYTLATTNLVRLIARQFFDVGMRHPVSIARGFGIPN